MEKINDLCCGGGKSGKIIMGILFAALAVYVLALAFNAIKANKYIGREAAMQSTITISGDGEVYKTPDLAVMNFSVVSEGKTVAVAMADNTKKMNAIVDVAKSLGVAEKDLQTSGFNINPRYDYVKTSVSSTPTAVSASPEIALASVDESVYYPNGKRILSGYDITQTLTVKMRDLTKIGQVIQEVTAAGANQVGDLQFTLDDPDTAQAEARKIAIDKAKEKAKVLAVQLGVKLVRILNYSDGGYNPVYLNYAKAVSMDSAAGGGAVAPSIQTGENKITANVSISYEIE
jgi:hypothetical protein